MKKLTIFLFGQLIIFQINGALDCRNLYLDLMKRCLINSIYQDGSYRSGDERHAFSTYKQYDASDREGGKDWPLVAHTMVGLKRLNNIQYCVEDVLKKGVPGDFIETGVWRGGSTIFMRAILKAYDITNRFVWVADSFAGLPAPDVKKYPADEGLNLHEVEVLAVPLATVKLNFQRYNLLDEQVHFLKGWFKDTLPTAPIEKLAILRLDGDLYESTMDALVNLYPKLSVGGYVIIDDYSIDACAQATHDFRKKNNITDPIYNIDNIGIFWQRTK